MSAFFICTPPPIIFALGSHVQTDNYGFKENYESFLGRGVDAFSTYANKLTTYSVVQLPLGSEALRTTNEFFAFSLQNQSRSMFYYHSQNCLEHTQKKLFKRSNFRYLTEIASSAYYGNKATLAAPVLQQYTFPSNLPANENDAYTFSFTCFC